MDVNGQMIELKAQMEQMKSAMAAMKEMMAVSAEGDAGSLFGGMPGLPMGEFGDGCFIVRWCKGADGRATGQWEILLPPGCFAVGGSCETLNREASETTGHEGEEYWYKINLDESVGSLLEKSGYGADGNETTILYRKWEITVHAKTSAKKYGVDALNISAKRYMYVAAVPHFEPGDEDEEELQRTWKDSLGDEFSRVVATAYLEDAGDETRRRAEQTTSNAVNVAGAARRSFELVWYFSVDESNVLEVEKVYCVGIGLSAAGMMLKGDDMVDVSAIKEIEDLDEENTTTRRICAKIRTNSQNLEENIVEVEVDPEPAASDDFTTWLKLYEIDWKGSIRDNREWALTNVQIYR